MSIDFLRRSVAFELALSFVAFAVTACSVSPLLAQPAKPKPPDPEEINLTCKDALQLKATYYPGTKGKETVPVILVHAWKGSRADFEDLAKYLQTEYGYAVVNPDLRGHGKSTKIHWPNQADGDVDANKLQKADFLAMAEVQMDIDKIKTFLLSKNNAGQLNIEKLCLVGAEMGATLAAKYATMDWAWPPLPQGKQGQDVRALVLISPESNFKGINIMPDLQSPVGDRLSYLVMVGKGDVAALREADRIHKVLQTAHVEPAADQVADRQDLFYWAFDTKFQGTKLFAVSPLKREATDTAGVDYRQLIGGFIDLRLVKREYPWAERKSVVP